MFGVHSVQNIGLDYSHWSHSAAAVVPDEVAAVVALIAIVVFTAILIAVTLGGSSNQTGWWHRRQRNRDVVLVVDSHPQPSRGWFGGLFGGGSRVSSSPTYQTLPPSRTSYHGGSGTGARTTTAYGGGYDSFSSSRPSHRGGGGYESLPASRPSYHGGGTGARTTTTFR